MRTEAFKLLEYRNETYTWDGRKWAPFELSYLKQRKASVARSAGKFSLFHLWSWPGIIDYASRPRHGLSLSLSLSLVACTERLCTSGRFGRSGTGGRERRNQVRLNTRSRQAQLVIEIWDVEVVCSVFCAFPWDTACTKKGKDTEVRTY
jgi:hypothetical protein